MDIQLAKSTINQLFEDRENIKAEGKVRSLRLPLEMALVGFIPYQWIDINYYGAKDLKDQEININTDLIVTSGRIGFKDGKYTYPIMSEVIKPSHDVLVFDRTLRIFKLPSQDKSPFIEYFNNPSPESAEKLMNWLKQYHNDCACLFTKNDDGLLMYNTQENDIIFKRNNWGDYTCIGNRFFCLCNFVNSVTGLPSYALFDPHEIIKVVSEEDAR